MPQPAPTPRRAIVLSGGGARGAYEAGVLRFILGDLSKRLGRPAQLDLLLGTSVGAVHACFLAATAEQGAERAEALARIWSGMQLEELFPIPSRSWLSLPQRLLRGAARATDRHHGLLDTGPLEEMVASWVPWREIERNAEAGRFRALCIAATQVETGRVALFGQGPDFDLLRHSPDPLLVPRPVALGLDHAMASAAIPILFPAVRIDGFHYLDGGLRLNAPLAPAIHLGADRILVIGLRRAAELEPAAAGPERATLGGRLALYGRALNALLVDPLDTDLGRMRFVNDILRRGQAAFGEDFLEKLNGHAAADGSHRLRVIDELVFRPAVDFAGMAAEALRARRAGLSASFRVLFRLLESQGGNGDSEDLASFLLFDRHFTRPLMDLGEADARAREAELAAFFEPA